MSIILSNYLHEYRTRLSERAHSIPLHQAIIAFTKEYRDHARTVSKQIDLASRYRMSKDHPLAKSLLREARLSLLLALEDLHGRGPDRARVRQSGGPHRKQARGYREVRLISRAPLR